MPSKLNWSIKRFSAFGAMLLVVLVALAQGDWSLGALTWTTGQPSPPLQFNLASSGGLGSYDFVSRVGGVAFSGIAKPGEMIGDKAIALHYDKTAPDGQRLRVMVEGLRDVFADVPDWILIPTAKFANTNFDACVSLFGPNTNATAYDIVYHASFQNSLLGLRLLQADMMLFNLGETWRLPQRGGVFVLGAGESAPQQMDQDSAQVIDSALSGGSFQSWVMTDQGEEVILNWADGRLELTGEPYYYFWSSDVEAVQEEKLRLREQAEALRKAGRVAEHNRIVKLSNAMIPKVTEVTDLTQRLKNKRTALRRFNPSVYNAATQTMRYSALFRYAKKNNPKAWQIFRGETLAVSVEPAIVTPTRWAR